MAEDFLKQAVPSCTIIGIVVFGYIMGALFIETTIWASCKLIWEVMGCRDGAI